MIKLKVTGMTCEHCEKAVHKALIAVPGVADVVTVDRTTEEVIVDGHANVIDLVAAIREEGYEAEVE
jgi:copper chaperone